MTAANEDLPPEAYYDEPWPSLLPWLSHHPPESTPELTVLAPSPDWWLTESPAVTTMAVDHEHLCRRLARTFMNRHVGLAMDEGFPALPERLPLAALPTGARARTAFQRLGAHTVGDLGRLTVEDLYEIRGTGQGTIEDIISALVSAAITRPAALGTSGYENTDDWGATEPAEPLPPGQLQLIEDLRQMTEWWHIRGRGDQALFQIVIEDGAPEQLQDAVSRINSLTAADLTPQRIPPDPLLDLTTVLGAFDERQMTVLRERLLAEQPKKLSELGELLNVSRERVRQVESTIKEKLTSSFHYGTAIGNLLASIRVEIQPIAALERLIRRHPELARNVPGIGVPLWLVLDRLDDYFEVTDGWAAAPDTTVAREQTKTLLEDFATEHGVVDLARVSWLAEATLV